MMAGASHARSPWRIMAPAKTMAWSWHAGRDNLYGNPAMSWKVCHATVTEPEAYLVKGFLEHQGIPCLLENGRFGMEPVRIGSLGTIRILVPEEWVPVASKLISRRTRPPRPSLPERRIAQVIAVDFARRRRRRTVRRGRPETP